MNEQAQIHSFLISFSLLIKIGTNSHLYDVD